MGQDPVGFRHPDVGHVLQGTSENIIACIHGNPIVPLRLDGRFPPSEFRIINDVIMDKGGHMHELEGYSRMFDHNGIAPQSPKQAPRPPRLLLRRLLQGLLLPHDGAR